MKTAEFDYQLPPDLIAQKPSAERDQSRLMVINRATGDIAHRQFPDLLDQLRSGDVLVLNNSRVVPARLRAANKRTPGRFEVLLLAENAPNDWWAMMKPGKRAPIGTEIELLDADQKPTGIIAVVQDVNPEGHRRVLFSGIENIFSHLDRIGEIPLPPYIERPSASDKRQEEDRERYQTVYAQTAGSVAAPTAGLHFSQRLLEQIRQLGVRICFVTLHVGLGTFAPVKAEELSEHVMHEERFDVPEETAREIAAAKTEGRRIIAVGTTSVRVLESVAKTSGVVASGSGRTRIFIFPPYDFKIVDALVTNFHLPKSTLLMLVSAFAAPAAVTGRELMLRAYNDAIAEKYRFFSYGDAMLIV